MSTGQTHARRPGPQAALVRRLIAAQFPQWAELAVDRVDSAGTSNDMFRLGADMVVRLPRTDGAAEDVAKEHEWLPRLAPALPSAIPAPLGLGEPTAEYGRPWSVYRWLGGETPVPGRLVDPVPLARDLAGFVAALRRVAPAGGPPAYRSEPLAARDAATRAAIGELRGVIGADLGAGAAAGAGVMDAGAATDAVTAAWEAALRLPEPPGPPVWIHSDLQPGNLLTARGRLSAVIDFGCLGLGDAAVDLMPAWYLLPPEARGVFRAALEADDAAWARGRGWALSVALLELSHYRETNAVMAGNARHVIGAVLADHARAAA